ncbi:MAG: glycosyltransferase [Balneolaceae bacterium]
MRYSVVIPVYNRPDEVDELLDSLTRQTYTSFEVLIVEDGSTKSCEEVVSRYTHRLDIRYFEKENSGQGFSRNFGFDRCRGDFFVVFDSDCIIPPHYFDAVNEAMENEAFDCWGGPDRAHTSFSTVQKAINYAMTSLFTTGGIRGRKKRIDVFHPRSFNMGISRNVYEQTGGYAITRMGEDLEFSIRIMKQGFKAIYIHDAYVYHKRRTDLRQFARQLHFFGRARINIQRFHPEELKMIHFFPILFLMGLLSLPFLSIFSATLFTIGAGAYALFALLLFADAFRMEGNITIAALSVAAGFIQLSAYGIGFFSEFQAELTAGEE